MEKEKKMSLEEVAEIKRRRPGARASLAIEGLFLTDEEETLFDSMDKERLTFEQRIRRLLDFSRAKRREKAHLPA